MGVLTTADETLEHLRKDLNKCIHELKELVFEEPWGIDQFDKSYRIKLMKNLNRVMEIKDDLFGI
jgi:hypothetical protein